MKQACLVEQGYNERREVAEELRKTRGIMAFVEALGIDPDGDWCWADVSRRVADLIDPTCHNQNPRASDGCFCCSECLFLYEPTDWSACRNGFLYCPRCGARVVRGGED